MIKLLRSKKLKRVKRVPKLKKFKFEDEQKTLNSKSNYMKFVYIIILAISFSVGNFFVINPTIQKANLIESDYNQKKNFINTSNELRASIVSKNEKVEKEFFEIQKSVDLPFEAMLIGFLVGAITISATNGGIGIYPFSVSLVLISYGISKESSLAFGWIMWTAQTIMVILFGSLSFFALPLLNRKK